MLYGKEEDFHSQLMKEILLKRYFTEYNGIEIFFINNSEYFIFTTDVIYLMNHQKQKFKKHVRNGVKENYSILNNY